MELPGAVARPYPRRADRHLPAASDRTGSSHQPATTASISARYRTLFRRHLRISHALGHRDRRDVASVPTFRPDITPEIDLVEEVGRRVWLDQSPHRPVESEKIAATIAAQRDGARHPTGASAPATTVFTLPCSRPANLASVCAEPSGIIEVEEPLRAESRSCGPPCCGLLPGLRTTHHNGTASSPVRERNGVRSARAGEPRPRASLTAFARSHEARPCPRTNRTRGRRLRRDRGADRARPRAIGLPTSGSRPRRPPGFHSTCAANTCGRPERRWRGRRCSRPRPSTPSHSLAPVVACELDVTRFLGRTRAPDSFGAPVSRFPGRRPSTWPSSSPTQFLRAPIQATLLQAGGDLPRGE